MMKKKLIPVKEYGDFSKENLKKEILLAGCNFSIKNKSIFVPISAKISHCVILLDKKLYVVNVKETLGSFLSSVSEDGRPKKFPLDYELDDNGQLHLFLKDGTLIIDLATYKKLQKEVKK